MHPLFYIYLIHIVYILLYYVKNFAIKIIEREKKKIESNSTAGGPAPELMCGNLTIEFYERYNKKAYRVNSQFCVDWTLIVFWLNEPWHCMSTRRIRLFVFWAGTDMSQKIYVTDQLSKHEAL